MSKDFCCNKCGSLDVFMEEKGSQTGLYCSDGCGWIKWVSKKDIPYARKQIENNKIVVDTPIKIDFDRLKKYYEQKKLELEVDNNSYNRGFVKGLEMAMILTSN